MAILDVFKADGFSMMDLTEAANLTEFKPELLGEMNIFRSNPIMTNVVGVEQREDSLSLIPTTPRGAPPTQRGFGARKLRNFDTVRIRESDRIQSSELQFLRGFGQEQQVLMAMEEVNRRQEIMIQDNELTKENMRLGAVQGILTDADGSTIVDYFSEFGIAQPSEIAFDLGNTADGDLRGKVASNVTRPIRRSAKGLVSPSDPIIALCGDDFFDQFVNMAEVRDVIKRSPRQEELLTSSAFQEVDLFGVRWINYRGTDDNSTVAIDTDKVKFFPQSDRVFEVAWSPGEKMADIGERGRSIISSLTRDVQRDEWVELDIASYPLYICKRPQVLLRGKRGA